MSGAAGGLAGALFGGGRKKPRRPRVPVISQAQKDLDARKKKADEELKKSAALKLAQIATGAGGILKEAETARKKLLGN